MIGDKLEEMDEDVNRKDESRSGEACDSVQEEMEEKAETEAEEEGN